MLRQWREEEEDDGPILGDLSKIGTFFQELFPNLYEAPNEAQPDDAQSAASPPEEAGAPGVVEGEVEAPVPEPSSSVDPTTARYEGRLARIEEEVRSFKGQSASATPILSLEITRSCLSRLAVRECRVHSQGSRAVHAGPVPGRSGGGPTVP